jgi:hypothetical protein
MILLLITFASLLVAVIMSVVAWRTAGEERRRSNARVAALAADIHDGDFDLGSSEPGHGRETAPIGDLFATAQPAQSGSRFAIAVACGVIVVGSLATMGLLLSRGSGHPNAAAPSQPTPAGLANPAPLELLALGHERTGDDLTVRGVVRNPSSGMAVERLTAVVFLFNREGGFLTSGRATVEAPALVPGGESRFVVSVPSAGDVGRYRVSFRTDDRVVPHVDRREPALARR